MNDLSQNIYIAPRKNTLSNYSLQRFLHNELAIERAVDINDAVFAVYGLILSHGVPLQLAGTKFLTSLVSRYIIKSDYTEDGAIHDIAVAEGMPKEYIINCIKGCLDRATQFKYIASKLLNITIKSTPTSITDIVEILGAEFKILYNYTVDTEKFQEDMYPTINLNRIKFENGKSGKKH